MEYKIDGLFVCEFGIGIEMMGKNNFEVEKMQYPDERHVAACASWIEKFVIMSKRENTKYGSYGLKHAVEKWAFRSGILDNQYVTNGSFIVAAHMLGYKVFPYPPNACFNMWFPRVTSKEFAEAFPGLGYLYHSKRPTPPPPTSTP